VRRLVTLIFLEIILGSFWVTEARATGYIISTVAGSGTSGYSGDNGPATSASFFGPSDVAVDNAGNFYISELSNIRKVSSTGTITGYAGDAGGTSGFSGDGGAATSAALNGPQGVAADRAGNLYIADTTNVRIRKVNTSGVISTYAGNGTSAFFGDGGLATSAELISPRRVAVDSSGNLYITDFLRIRKVNTSGIISTVAGNGTSGFSGDGGLATSAKLNSPLGVAVDSAGNLYIADFGNQRIRKVNTGGIITTVAGNGTSGFSGDGGLATSAKLNSPQGVAVDSAGNIYIADSGNQRIREVSTSGVISTIAGDAISGFSGDGGPATLAELNNPQSVAIVSTGNLYVMDSANLRVRLLVAYPAPAITTQPQNQIIVVGQATTLLVVASGNLPSYQWKKNGSAIAGATSAFYTTPVTACSDNNSQFQCVVSNPSGTTPSNTVTLTVSGCGSSNASPGAATDLSAVKAYPNPLRFSQGETQMNFVNLPPQATAKVYTVTGELVATLAPADSSGATHWDGNTGDSGHHAASGVYFVSLGWVGETKTIKISVQR